MKYTIITIGKLKHSFYRQACEHYEKRLQPYGKTNLLELKEAKANQDSHNRQIAESEKLLAAVPVHSYIIGLDERGEELSSQRMAATITRLNNQSISHMSLLIGGAEGHSDELRQKCDTLWRLSSLTLPHDLARLVLLEQLYRAETIRAGHPYHREG